MGTAELIGGLVALSVIVIVIIIIVVNVKGGSKDETKCKVDKDCKKKDYACIKSKCTLQTKAKYVPCPTKISNTQKAVCEWKKLHASNLRCMADETDACNEDVAEKECKVLGKWEGAEDGTFTCIYNSTRELTKFDKTTSDNGEKEGSGEGETITECSGWSCTKDQSESNTICLQANAGGKKYVCKDEIVTAKDGRMLCKPTTENGCWIEDAEYKPPVVVNTSGKNPFESCNENSQCKSGVCVQASGSTYALGTCL